MPEGFCVLGFDFGMKRIGVAVGQTITQTANPLTILKALDGVPQWEQVQNLIDQWQPQALIVGIPLNMDGTEQNTTKAAKRFANKLHGRFRLPVHHVDERLTSIEAKKLTKKTAPLDAVAAKLIVETWLRQKKSSQ